MLKLDDCCFSPFILMNIGNFEGFFLNIRLAHDDSKETGQLFMPNIVETVVFVLLVIRCVMEENPLTITMFTTLVRSVNFLETPKEYVRKKP